jgi:hypothetical protein
VTVNAQDPTLTINAEALEGVLAMINARPDLHNQSIYVDGDLFNEYKTKPLIDIKGYGDDWLGIGCGTAACFAGWGGVLYGEQYGYQPFNGYGSYWVKAGATTAQVRQGQANGQHVSTMATKIFGITGLQAEVLFNAGNTRPMLGWMVKDLINTGDLRHWCDYANESAEGITTHA